MINRILIRIKVVQMLYSYLLTKSDFSLPRIPESVSRDRQYAFTLYNDLLLFLLKMSGLKASDYTPSPNKYLSANKFLLSLNSDATVKVRLDQNHEGFNVIEPLIPEMLSAATACSAYRSYIRTKNRDVTHDVILLTGIVEAFQANEKFYDSCRNISGFTNNGYEQAFEMVKETLKSFCDNRVWLADAQNSLKRSLDKAYDLYRALLMLPVELTDMQERHLDSQRHKHLATADDLNPNMKFVDNKFVAMVRESEAMNSYLKDTPFKWLDENEGMLRRLLERITSSQEYADYMASDADSLSDDCDIWKEIYKKMIFPSDDLAEALEAMSVYWNDDLNIMDSFVLKTVKRTASEGHFTLLPKYKDEEDARFGFDLFNIVVNNRREYRALIDKFINQAQWDSERLAFMDIVIMITAIAELISYPAIPIPVTLNEYIEIANCYSTPKSGQFINGILYSVINYLQSEGRLNKK